MAGEADTQTPEPALHAEPEEPTAYPAAEEPDDHATAEESAAYASATEEPVAGETAAYYDAPQPPEPARASSALAPELPRPPADLGGAMRRYWPLVLLPALLLGSLALFVSANRSPTYTAEARLIVGGLDVSTRSVPGFAEASESLAQTYSRSVTADAVVRPVARRLGISPGEARSRLAGTGLPDSAVLRVQATGPDAKSAVRLANAGARGLIAYVDRLRPETDQTDTLLRDYKQAALSLSRAETRLELLRPLVLGGGGEDIRRQFEEATVDVDTARLRMRTIGDLYSLRRQTSQETDLLSVLNLASGASSDRSSSAQRLLFVGGAAGLAIGLALAAALDARRRRRD